MRKARPLRNAGWTSDLSEDRAQFGSQVDLLGKKKKSKQKSKEGEESFKLEEQPIESKDNIASGNTKLINTRSKSKLKRTGNVKSTDSTESVTDSTPNTIDVVVDIHGYGDKKPHGNLENVETILEGSNEDTSGRSDTSKIFSARTTVRDRTNEKRRKERLQDVHDDVKLGDTLDLIEEFHDSPESKSESSPDGRVQVEGKIVPDEKRRTRKQWDVPDRLERTEDGKKPRKRWSKNTSVIRLPESKSASSASTSSMELVSPVNRISEKPVPMPRSSLRQDPALGFDNEAFVSDAEEVLRVETDHNTHSMKIELRRASDVSGNFEASVRDGNYAELVERKSGMETVINVGSSTESENETMVSDFPRRENTVIAMEDSESETQSSQDALNCHKIRSPIKSEVRMTELNSQSSEESDERSGHSSQKEVKKPRQTWTRRKARKSRKGRSRSRKETSSQETNLSTNEDEESDDNHPGVTHSDDEAVSIPKRTESRNGEELPRKRERRKGRTTETGSPSEAQNSNIDADVRRRRKKRKKREERKKEEKYISVTVHRADLLETDYVTKHPMVKVHIVAAETGKYLKSTQEDTGSTYLQPVITGKFDFKENRSMIPVWEEELILRHDFDDLLKTGNEQVVILFEIIDLLTFSQASSGYDKFGNEGCFYKVAWAFLKPVGRENSLHTDKKVRLQLYRPARDTKKFQRHKCEVYTWWKSNSREKYPSSLFVTVTSVDPPKLEPVFYQQLSLHDVSDVLNNSQKLSSRTSDSLSLPKWTRLAAQSCKIPNEKFFETEVSENGCFFVAFSNDGKYVASVLSEEYDYPVVVHEVDTKKIHVRFLGHKTFVYSLNWSDNDHYLLSASSDQTARIWDVRNQIIQYVEMMPHPSYVYCGKFEHGNTLVVATGCYDRVARIWVKGKKSKSRDLSQELEGHEGFVNSMCFQKDGTLLTADSVGVVIIWTVKRNRKMPSRKEWHISRKIRVREIEGVTINTIVLHPLESRLLVHSRNNGLRMLDLATGVVLQKYSGLNNQRIQSAACISPCGGLILCGGEDSSLSVWSLETGKYLAKYTLERNSRAVTCVDYHPYGHMLAFSTFGSPSPVRILKFNKDATGEDVGLKIMESSEIRAHSSDVSMSFLNISLPSTGRSRSNSRKRTPNEVPKERPIDTRNRRSIKSTESPPRNEETADRTRLQLQRLNETEQTLKNRSTNRLHNIIQKIDRILSNTSRSSDDVEAGRSLTLNRDITRISEDRIVEVSKEEWKSKKSKSSTMSNIEEHSSSYFGSSTLSSVKNEAFELIIFCGTKDRNTEIIKKRSRSARETRVRNIFDDDLSKTFSDSAANTRKQRVYNEIVEAMQEETILTAEPINGLHRIPSSIVFHKIPSSQEQRSSSLSSTGTYVVEKADVERNNDGSLRKLVESETIGKNKIFRGSEIERASGSESISMRSNATFVLETEIPVPKPRRKNLS